MNGSVSPFVGSTPMFTPMLMNACSPSHSPKPSGEIGRELQAGVLREPRDVEAAPDERHEQRERQHHADEAQLFGEHREQEVRVRLGQVEELLHALAEPHAEPLRRGRWR